MRCPFCAENDTRVLDSRLANEGDQVRRRRECCGCKSRFTTYEVAELDMPDVVKCNGTRQPFDERKLNSGFLKALEKRPVNRDTIVLAVNRIKRSLMGKQITKFPANYWVRKSWRSYATLIMSRMCVLRRCIVALRM